MFTNIKQRDKSGFLILRLLNRLIITFSGKRYYLIEDREETKECVTCRLVVYEGLGEYFDDSSDADYEFWLEESNHRDPVYDEVIDNPYIIYTQMRVMGSEPEEVEPFQMKINIEIVEPGREPIIRMYPYEIQEAYR